MQATISPILEKYIQRISVFLIKLCQTDVPLYLTLMLYTQQDVSYQHYYCVVLCGCKALSCALREGHIEDVRETGVGREGVAGVWRKIHNDELG
jgi:hypothetical protein